MLAKISLVISIVLSVVVAYLLMKSGNESDKAPTENVHVAPAFTAEGGPKPTIMAVVNGDSLNSRYEFIVEKSRELEVKMKSAEERVAKEYGPRQAEYERNVRYYQENPNMSQNEAMALEEDIKRLQVEMDEIQQREVGVLQKKEADLQKELMTRVNKYLEVFSKERGIDYVINQQSEFQMILYGNAAYDVTSEVISGLNAEYRQEKEKK